MMTNGDRKGQIFLPHPYTHYRSKKGSKDQELIQSSTTPDPGYHIGKSILLAHNYILHFYISKRLTEVLEYAAMRHNMITSLLHR